MAEHTASVYAGLKGEKHLGGIGGEHYHHPDPQGDPRVCVKCPPDATLRFPPINPDRAQLAQVRTFDTGATRDQDNGKLDYEAFLSPLVLKRYAEFMHKNRYQKDGSLRDGDNWQKGIPFAAYMKSAWRHHMEWWELHRDNCDGSATEEALCAVIFNAMGYLHELLKIRRAGE